MIAVTTVHKAPPELIETARARAAFLGLPYLERENRLDAMERDGIGGLLVYGKQGPTLWAGGAVHGFHTGTAKLRILAMQRGGQDRLCALLPEHTKSVLDCTFGEGKDSLVLSWYLGAAGEVMAAEKSAVLWEIGQCGLRHFQDDEESVTAALRRIHLVHADFRTLLKEAGPGAWDVVYIDTMFRRPVKAKENNRDAFRYGACYDELEPTILRDAVRAARRRVIVKERPFSRIFRCGLFHQVFSRHGQTTAYGVIDVNKEEP